MSDQTASGSMSGESRLFIWPKGTDVSAVKQEVESMDLPWTVKPFWYQAGISEGARRVLVLEDGFEYGTIVDYIYPKTTALIGESVRWALGLCESRGAHTVKEVMQSIFGEEADVWKDVHMPEWDPEWPDA